MFDCGDDGIGSDTKTAVILGMCVGLPLAGLIGYSYGPSDYVTAIEVGAVAGSVTGIGYLLAKDGIGGAIGGGAVSIIKGLICGIFGEL